MRRGAGRRGTHTRGVAHHLKREEARVEEERRVWGDGAQADAGEEKAEVEVELYRRYSQSITVTLLSARPQANSGGEGAQVDG